jgi:hypothetical protein
MMQGAPDVESPPDVSIAVPEIRRERVVVRRRRGRSRPRVGQWSAMRSRRRTVRAFLVCTGVLVLMALGLYFGLSRQEIAPAESSMRKPMIAAAGVRG